LIIKKEKALMKKIKINSNVKVVKGNLFQKSSFPKVKFGNIIKGKINLKKNKQTNLVVKAKQDVRGKVILKK
tara:strand:- start:1477 stop:1692 length:216 start_codon:yes stop_codon:yes gene_type:complete